MPGQTGPAERWQKLQRQMLDTQYGDHRGFVRSTQDRKFSVMQHSAREQQRSLWAVGDADTVAPGLLVRARAAYRLPSCPSSETLDWRSLC